MHRRDIIELVQEITMRFISRKWTERKLDGLIRRCSTIDDPGSRIDLLSAEFIGTPYGESTLIGDAETQEELTINLDLVDCFTFIDYIEAMRLSCSFDGFASNLAMVRYRDGAVSFENRNHFFTDWRENNSRFVCDITKKTGGHSVRHAEKILNIKRDGNPWVRGIARRHRIIDFIPSEAVSGGVFERLKTGDYIGIYSPLAGLDVSHVGIFIRRDKAGHFRHASSSSKLCVVDQEFMKYITGGPGIVILRPNPQDLTA